MRSFRSLVLPVLLSATVVVAQDALVTNIAGRSTISLDGEWHYIIDPYENGFYDYRYHAFDEQEPPSRSAYFLNSQRQGPSDLIEYDFSKSPVIEVPGDWNTQDESLFYYEGTIWYERSFDHQKNTGSRIYVHFGAVNYRADVYLNGIKLGTHIGGFTPFNYEVTDLLKEHENFLIVKVDNKRLKEGVPTLNTDWWNYGGITRSVQLVEVPETFVEDYFIQLAQDNNELIKGQVQLNGPSAVNTEVSVSIPALEIEIMLNTDDSGGASFAVTSNNIRYWSPGSPFLYDVNIGVNGIEINDRIGFRTIKTEGSDILLNGEKVFLKGISIHEEKPIGDGRAHSSEDARKILTWVKDLGCNFVRLAHYPHSESMIRMADEMGIMVWEENPVYWTIQWENRETYANAENQLRSVIRRDKNRAAVIIWSMANETPASPSREAFLENLAATARSMDPTRLISAALEQSIVGGDPNVRTIDDPFAEIVDILSFNEYIGWYDGTPEKCRKIHWVIEADKPVFISEFGAGAKYGLHGDRMERWTEEYQEYLYRETLKMLDSIDQLAGMSPWILRDFRSPRRSLPEVQDGWNRKGLISDQGERKLAFYVLRDYYSSK